MNIDVMSGLRVPIISVVIGEGGSGGALALGVADRLLMLQYATYSVISPEGCASILWKDGSKASRAAETLGLRSESILRLGVADEIIEEPAGGAHRDPQNTAIRVGAAITRHLNELRHLSTDELLRRRYHKYRQMGAFSEK
jgi:acetyl-CoA carboxylase carboxyl transferase subunit alpha